MYRYIEEKLNREKYNPDKFQVHDFHSNDHIGTADTKDDAIKEVAYNDLQKNKTRTYRVCDGFCGPGRVPENTRWWGDSWKIGQYLEENGHCTIEDLNKTKSMTQHNANRFFGQEVHLEPTDIKDKYIVEVKNSFTS